MEDQQALELISRIVSDNFCEDLDIRNAHRKLRGDLATAHEKLGKVYRIAHALVKTKVCYHVHDDWRKEAERMVEVMEQEKTHA